MKPRFIHVAVAVVWREGRVLIARRPASAHQGDLLEFPGGKVEPGERVQQALARELAEETGVEVDTGSLTPLIGIRHDYGDKQVFLDVWQAWQSQGEARGLEGQPVFWLSPDELRDEDFPAANRPIIRALRLPSRLAITGEFDSISDGVQRLRAGLEAFRPSWLLVRAPWLNPDEYRVWLARVQAETRPCKTRLLVHDRPDLAGEERVAGVHMSQRALASLDDRPVSVKDWFGVSCHDPGELARAVALGADYATLSPVLPTSSHPGQPGLGWQRFQEQLSGAVLPVFALGGVGAGDVEQARSRGGQGIAGISWWWS